jgi:hypothetical protein
VTFPSRKDGSNTLPQGTVFQRTISGVGEEYVEAFCKEDKSLIQYSSEYSFFFLNTLHVYLRVSVNLFQLYCEEHEESLDPIHFELPCQLLHEDIQPVVGIAPENGWSTYVQALPKEQYPKFRDWLLGSKWRGRDAQGRVVVYDIFQEAVMCRDPVKLSTNQVLGIKEFVDIDFFMPGNGSGALKINVKNGPPFNCCYAARVNVKDHKNPFEVNMFRALMEEPPTE